MAASAAAGSDKERAGIRKRLKEGKSGKYRRPIERLNDADRGARVEELKALLRERIRMAAEEAADEAFGPEGMPWGTLFDDLEALAVAGGDLFSQSFMARAATRQAAAVPAECEVCPACGEPLSGDETDPRVLQTTRGDVAWPEPLRTCPACGRDFFPSVPEFRAGSPIVQPSNASQDAVCGGDVGLVPPGSGEPARVG